MKTQKKALITLDYAGMQGFYSMMYAGIGAFFSVFLAANGFTNTEIGLVISCANLLTVIFSPSIADFADRSRKVTLNQIILVAALSTGFMSFFLFILHGHTPALFIFYVLALAFHGFLQPLVNTVNFRIEEKGYHLNFGLCRSAGSICYAIMTAVVGVLIESMGIVAVPASTIVSMICLIISVVLLTKHMGSDRTTDKTKEEPKTETIRLSRFIRQNIPFLILNIGVAVLFYHSYVIGSFMLKIIEPMGGDAGDMGRMFSLAAAVEVPAMMSFGFLNNKYSSVRLLKFSLFGFLLKNILLFTARSLWMVYLAQASQIIGYALFYPAMVKFIGERMASGEAVKGQSLFTIMMTMSGVVANFTGGVILDTAGIRTLLLICLITAGVGVVVILMTADKVKVEKRDKVEEEAVLTTVSE